MYPSPLCFGALPKTVSKPSAWTAWASRALAGRFARATTGVLRISTWHHHKPSVAVGSSVYADCRVYPIVQFAMWWLLLVLPLTASACDPGLAGPLCLPCSTLCNATWVTCDETTGGSCTCMPGHTTESNCDACDVGYVAAASGRCLPCPVDECGVHGTCAPPVRDTVRHTARCQCDAGWTYADAADDTSQCVVCQATGLAYNDTDAGTNCLACDPRCASRGTCLPGGVCECAHPTAGPPDCAGCVEGYVRHPGTGLCVPCEGCAAGSNCTVNPGTGETTCVCPPGRVGLRCDTCGPAGLVLEDANGTCIHCPGDNGCPASHVCQLDDSGAAECACPPGWYGPECSVCDADTCALECECARRDPAASCIRRLGPDGVPETACRCGTNHTHAVPGDDTSLCRPCGDMETPTRCLTCPACDAASEVCIEVVGSAGNAVAACVCRDGWTPMTGWRSGGCFPAAAVQFVLDATADEAARVATDVYAESVRTLSKDHLGNTMRDLGSAQHGGSIIMAMTICGLLTAAAGGAIAVATFKCRHRHKTKTA